MTATETVNNTQGGRLIFGLVGLATVFSLVGNEIKVVTSSKEPATGFVTEGGKIIIGGTLATAFLLLLSHAGGPGNTLAVGLSVVTAASSLLVFGSPVWDEINKLFSSKPTTPLATVTAPATPVATNIATTAPTGGTK
jgi:hypothetical protein